MRVLHVAHSYAPEVSGVAEVVGQISQGLARRGHEVHVATGRPAHAPREETRDGVVVHRFSVRGNGATGMSGELDKYVSFVLSGRWDMVTMHCAQAWPADALLPSLSSLNSRSVFVGHGLSALANPAYAAYFRQLAAALHHVDSVVCLSEMLEEASFCARNGLPAPTVIPNGVRLESWLSPARGLRSKWNIGDGPWLLTVSNHSPVKQHSVFFQVARQVRARWPRAKATIVGDSYPAAKTGLGRVGVKGGCWYACRARALRARSGVGLQWSTPREDVVSAIKEADVVVVTSSREASPLVVLESMAAATPWVSFDVGCVRAHDGGLIAGNVVEMTEQILRLVGDSALRLRLGAAGRRQVEKGNSWDSIVSQYEQLYRSVLARSQDGQPERA